MSPTATDMIAHMREQFEREMRRQICGDVTTTNAVAADEGMTFEKLRQAIRDFNPPPPPPRLTITYSHYALKETTERLFPESKNRSKRILKKLIKRHGGEFRKAPTMYRIKDMIVAHPALRSQLEAQFKETSRVQMHAEQENPILWG